MRTKTSSQAVALNEEQLEAVHASVDKPVVVLAGPGSGKTAVIAARYSHMVDVAEIDPKNIIAVTFTGDMAAALLHRIKTTSLVAYDPQGISTIHAFALRQLKNLGMITTQKKALDWTIRQTIEDHIRLTSWDKSPSSIRWWIDRSKIEGIAQNEDDLWKYYEKAIKKLRGTEQDANRLTAAAMRVQYMLKDNRTWTFPDLVNDLWHATEDKKVLDKLQEKIKYILVDEGQDTFELAVKLLRRICPESFFIVGDPDQMLFRFTGASPETNLFQVADDGWLYKLTKNYRSAKTIVRAANDLITHNYTSDTQQYLKKMVSIRSNEGAIFKHNLFSGPQEEAAFVVDTIHGFNMNPGTVFVGARTNAQLAYVETEMARVGIPYTVLGTNGFFSMTHVKRVVDFLRVVEDPAYDPGGSERDTRWQKAFPSTKKAMNLAREYRATPLTLVDQAVTTYLAYHRKKYGLISTDAGQDDNVVDDLRTLVDIAGKFPTLHAFLEFVRTTEKAEWLREQNGVVVLATIHKLKGAERDIVFGIGWSEGLLPHSRALSSQPDGDLPIQLSGNVNDERCAAYVLVTRARREVYLSSISSYRDIDLEPSRFVAEIMG